jgi:hypothetical protein
MRAPITENVAVKKAVRSLWLKLSNIFFSIPIDLILIVALIRVTFFFLAGAFYERFT